MNNNEINPKLKELLEACMKCWPAWEASILAGSPVCFIQHQRNRLRRSGKPAERSALPGKDLTEDIQVGLETDPEDRLFNALRLPVLGKQPIRSVPL